MPTQEEVLEAIHKLGCATYKELKQYFKITNSGNSNLPQRLRGLEKKGLIYTLRARKVVIFVSRKYSEDQIKKLVEDKYGLRFTTIDGRIVALDLKELEAVFKIVKEKKIVTASEIQRMMGWNYQKTLKYLKALVYSRKVSVVRRENRTFYSTGLFLG